MEFKDFDFAENKPVAWMVFYGDDLILHTITTDKEKVDRYRKQNYIIINLAAIPVSE